MKTVGISQEDKKPCGSKAFCGKRRKRRTFSINCGAINYSMMSTL
jgi:hypothetical protein